jgi:hypothetical protein
MLQVLLTFIAHTTRASKSAAVICPPSLLSSLLMARCTRLGSLLVGTSKGLPLLLLLLLP